MQRIRSKYKIFNNHKRLDVVAIATTAMEHVNTLGLGKRALSPRVVVEVTTVTFDLCGCSAGSAGALLWTETAVCVGLRVENQSFGNTTSCGNCDVATVSSRVAAHTPLHHQRKSTPPPPPTLC